MTTQPTFFGYPIARTTQTGLFDSSAVVAHGITCTQCEATLVETENYLICPTCLGKLVPDVPESGAGRWFDDEDEL